MSIATTMTVLAAAPGLARKYDWPTQSVQVPCTVVGYPQLDPNQIFTGGKTVNTYPVYVLIGKAVERTARDALSVYLNGVPPLLNAASGTGIDYVNVGVIRIQEVTVAEVSYLAAVFPCDVMEVI